MPDEPKYSFMMPVTRLGSDDKAGVSAAMQHAGFGPLDKFERFPYVEIRCSVPWVKDRGYLILEGGWRYHSWPPGWAVFYSQRIGDSAALRIVLENLTPGKEYLALVDCECIAREPNPGIQVQDAEGYSRIVPAHDGLQTIGYELKPSHNWGGFEMRSLNLDSWTFRLASVFQGV